MGRDDRGDAEAKAAAERGYRVSGLKELRLREWHLKRELNDREFKKLENKLRVKKWRGELYAERGERYEAWRAKDRDRAKTPERRSKRAAIKRERQARKREEERRSEIFTCAECGVQWCLVPWAHGQARKRRHCSVRCYSRSQRRARTSREGKCKYTCSTCGEQGHTKLTCKRAIE